MIAEDARDLLEEPVRVGEIVERLVKQHDVEARPPEWKRVRVEPHERQPPPVSPLRRREQRRRAVAADDDVRPRGEVAEPLAGAAGHLQHAAPHAVGRRERVARVEHREGLAGDPRSRRLRDRRVVSLGPGHG